MTSKPLSERIREARHNALSWAKEYRDKGDSPFGMIWTNAATTLGFLAEIAAEQEEIKAMLKAREEENEEAGQSE